MQLQLQVFSKYFVSQSTYLIGKIILINSTSSLKAEKQILNSQIVKMV